MFPISSPQKPIAFGTRLSIIIEQILCPEVDAVQCNHPRYLDLLWTVNPGSEHPTWEVNSSRCTIVVLMALTSCSVPGNRSTAAPESLFSQLGGLEGLRPIVDDLTWRLVTDELLASTFVSIDIASFKEEALLFLCAKSGGPCLDGGERPVIVFTGSPSAAANRLTRHLREASLARGAKRETATQLIERVERDVRAFIGPPRG